jgi:hypothetical protein
MALSTVQEAITRFKESEERTHILVNDPADVGYYTTDTAPSKQVETYPHFIKRITNTANGYVQQAAASAASANASKNAAAASATKSENSALRSDENAGIAVLAAGAARVSASDASISAAKAKWYADGLEGVDETLAEHRLSIAWNKQGLDDLAWTPWGIAITACRESRSAVVQAMNDYRADMAAKEQEEAIARSAEAQDQAIAENRLNIAWNAQHIADSAWTPWGIAITACRTAHSAVSQAIKMYKMETEHQTALAAVAWEAAITNVRHAASAIRQAVEIANLYRLIDFLAAGGGSGSGGMAFVPSP